MRRALRLKDPRFPAPRHRAEEPPTSPTTSPPVGHGWTWTISVYNVGFAVRGPVRRKWFWHSPALAAVPLQASLWSHEKLFKFSTERLCGGTAGQPFPSSVRRRQTPGVKGGVKGGVALWHCTRSCTSGWGAAGTPRSSHSPLHTFRDLAGRAVRSRKTKVLVRFNNTLCSCPFEP